MSNFYQYSISVGIVLTIYFCIFGFVKLCLKYSTFIKITFSLIATLISTMMAAELIRHFIFE